MNIKIINLNEISLDKYTKVFSKLNDYDKNKLQNMPLTRKKHFIAGRYLLLINNIDISQIYYNDNKKPLVNGRYFSISHSEDYTVVAISDNPVGIDIEKIRDVDSSVKKYFGNNDKMSNEDFIKIFTKKESYIKCYGLALKNYDDCTEYLDIITKKFKNYYISICKSCQNENKDKS